MVVDGQTARALLPPQAVWLNADIVPGPNSRKRVAIPADSFLPLCRAPLLGWRPGCLRHAPSPRARARAPAAALPVGPPLARLGCPTPRAPLRPSAASQALRPPAGPPLPLPARPPLPPPRPPSGSPPARVQAGRGVHRRGCPRHGGALCPLQPAGRAGARHIPEIIADTAENIPSH